MTNRKKTLEYSGYGCVVLVILSLFFSFSLTSVPYQNLFKECLEAPRSSVKGIDGTYVINLDVRPERWHRLEPLLFYHGIDHCRFPAVVGLAFDEPTLWKYSAKHLRFGQLGCMLSHLSIYHDALKRDLDVIWVMEDDVEIKRDPQLLTGLIKELDEYDPQWDVIYTDLDMIWKDGSFLRSCVLPVDKKRPLPYPLSYYVERKNISKNFQRIHSKYGTTSMILSKRGIKKILDHFTTYDDIVWPFDIEIHYVPGIRQYGIRNPIVTNCYFLFYKSDAGRGFERGYYEIDDENIQFLEQCIEKQKRLHETFKKWH